MKKLLLIVPSGKCTIASVSYNLYLLLLKNNVEVEVVNLHSCSDDIYFKDIAYKYNANRRSTIFGKILSYYDKIYFLRKVKKIVKPDISISTITSCNAYNILTSIGEIKYAFLHSPLKQTLLLGSWVFIASKLSYIIFYKYFAKVFCVTTTVLQDYNTVISPFYRSNAELFYNIHDVDNIICKSHVPIDNSNLFLFDLPVVLYLGRMDSNKAPYRLISASTRLIDAGYRFNTIFMGSFYDMNKDDICSNLSPLHHQYIHFIDEVENPYNYLSKASVLVSCSKSEGLPGVLIESLILDTPIISTNSSVGIWEILSCQGDYVKDLSELYFINNSIIVPNKDDSANHLLEAIANVLDKIDQYSLMESNKAFLINNNYDYVKTKIQHHEIF